MKVYERDGRWYGEVMSPDGTPDEADLEIEAADHVLTTGQPVTLPTDEISAKYILLLRASGQWRRQVRWATGI